MKNEYNYVKIIQNLFNFLKKKPGKKLSAE